MTGRINLSSQAISAASEGLGSTGSNDSGDERTIAFTVETEQAVMEAYISSSMDYRPSQEIARGGMGRIYAADDPFLSRAVALKVSTARGDKDDAQFLREARTLAQLAHPNIVPVHHLGKDGHGRPFYSMKLVKGRNLRAVLKSLLEGDPATLAVYNRQHLLNIFRKVCDAVSFAHAKGFLHRDLKPENIMVGEYGEVLVMDWGLAKQLFRQASSAEDQFCGHPEPETLDYVEGTPQYMSPEQAAGMFGGLDERSDIYSLGAILFAILTFQPPVTGKSVNEVLEKVREGDIKTLTVKVGSTQKGVIESMPERIPEALRAITLKALSRDRDKRYANVQALVADLEAYQGGFATSAEDANLLRHAHLFVKRHKVASALVLLLFISAIGFTMRLFASEKRAVTNAERANANAQQLRLEKEAARRLNAETQIALAEAAEGDAQPEQMRTALDAVPEDLRDASWRYLNARLNTFDLVIEPPSGTRWLGVENDTRDEKCMFALQDDGVFNSVNIVTGEITPLWSFSVQFWKDSILSVSSENSLAACAVRRKSNKIDVCDFEVRRIADGALICAVKNAPVGVIQRMWVSEHIALIAARVNQHDKVSAFEIQSGQLLWEKTSSGDDTRAFCAGFSEDAKAVFLLTEMGEVQKLNPSTGQTLSVVDKKIKVFRASTEEAWAANNDWGFFYVCTPDKPNMFRKFNTSTGELILQRGLLAGLNCSLGLVRNLNVVCSLTRRSDQGCVLEVFENNPSAKQLGLSPFLGKISKRGELARIRTKEGRVAVQLPDKILVWRIYFDESDQWSSSKLGRRHSASTVIADKIFHAGYPEKNGDVLIASEDIGKNFTGKRNPKVEVLGPSRSGSTLTTSRDGSRVLVGFNGYYSAYLYDQKILSLVWSKLLKTGSANKVPFVLHPTEDLAWTGNTVLEFSTGRILTKVDRTGIAGEEDNNSKVDWIGADHIVEVVTVIPPGERADSGLESRALRLWNVKTGGAVATVDASHAVTVTASPDGEKVAEGGDDKRLRLRSSKNLSVERDVRVHDKALNSVLWHPTLPLIVTCSEDMTVRIWDLPDFTLVHEYRLRDEALELFISVNGTRLYAKTPSGMNVFNPECFQR